MQLSVYIHNDASFSHSIKVKKRDKKGVYERSSYYTSTEMNYTVMWYDTKKSD